MLKHYLLKKLSSLERGFTLIELLVVAIIVGILSAVSMPNLLGQIGKARETEASSQLGAISRSQQAYHFEIKQFAPTMDSLSINVAVVDGYYGFPDPSIASDSLVKHQATAISPWDVSSRNFALGVYYDSGIFSTILCRSSAPTTSVDVPSDPTDPCTNNGVAIR